MLGFQSTCTSQQVSKLFFSWCQSSYPVKLIFAWIWGIFGSTNINYCTSYLKKSHPPYKTSILTTLLLYMQSQAQCRKNWYSGISNLNLELKFFFKFTDNRTKCPAIQKVERTKPVFEQTLSTDQPLYWALLNVPVLICLNIFFLRLKMMMWRTWWNMQHQVNLSYSVFLWKVIFLS